MSSIAADPAGADAAASGAPPEPGPARSGPPPRVRRALGLAALAATFGIELWLAFHAGGFFAGTTAIVVLALGLALVAWLMTAARPLDGLSRPLAVAVAGFVLLAGWQLLSQRWSGSPARAVVEFDRTLLYALVVLLAGLVATTAARRRALLLTLFGAMVVVCGCALITRLLPEVWPVEETVAPSRLSYPVTYWNALGMMAALALLACVHVACDHRERLAIRATAVAALPMLATTLLLTFSRGAIAAAALGFVVYLVLARPRGAIVGFLAGAPTTAAAVAVAYASDAVVDAPTSAAVVSQGRTVMLVVVAAMAAAAGLLALGRRFVEPWVLAWRIPRVSPGRLAVGAVVALLVVAGGVVASGLSQRLADQVDSFRTGNVVDDVGDSRSRLTTVGNNGRLYQWRVSTDVFERHPLDGSGAGTFAISWARDRPSDLTVNDGHSLVFEALGELGLVGVGLLALALGALLVGGAWRIRGPQRALAAALFTLLAMWLLRAQIDWDWEMPVLTAPALACGAALVGGRGATAQRGAVWPGRVPRLLAGIGILVVLLTPLAVARSQAKLDAASAALKAGDCRSAIDDALAATKAMSSRPEPFQVLALCDARIGRGDLALAAIRAGLERDPDNWRLHYQLAVIGAAQGIDPRPQLRVARRLNPRSTLLRDAQRRFATSDPARWRARARTAPLPL